MNIVSFVHFVVMWGVLQNCAFPRVSRVTSGIYKMKVWQTFSVKGQIRNTLGFVTI